MNGNVKEFKGLLVSVIKSITTTLMLIMGNTELNLKS